MNPPKKTCAARRLPAWWDLRHLEERGRTPLGSGEDLDITQQSAPEAPEVDRGPHVFDLDGTIVGKVKNRYVLRPGMVSVIQNPKKQGDTVILWTFGNRAWWRRVQQMFPPRAPFLRGLHEGRTAGTRHAPRPGGPAAVKDIRIIAGDVLVDNDPSHHEWAARHGLAGRYVKVATVGE